MADNDWRTSRLELDDQTMREWDATVLASGPDGIVLAAVPGRDDPRDALIGRDGAKLADLPPGASIGTGSPRRAAQLLLLRQDIRCVPIRGNAGTRLAKVGAGELGRIEEEEDDLRERHAGEIALRPQRVEARRFPNAV